MSLIKKLIQRLLDSRTTPEEAAHSAMPQENQVINYGSTTENPGSWTTILSFTAPKDGYAKAVVVGTGKNSAELYCGNMRVSAFAPVDNASINVVMPVRKGASVGLVSTVFRSAALYFIPSIGGGYNCIVWRALSCLKPSFNYLLKSFFKVNIPTLLINADQVPVHKARQSQETARRISWLHSQVGLSLRLAQTVRQTTHGLGLKTPPEELHTSPMQFANTKRLLSQCKKEMFLLLTSALITRTKAPFCLSPLKQQNNLRTGGALC